MRRCSPTLLQDRRLPPCEAAMENKQNREKPACLLLLEEGVAGLAGWRHHAGAARHAQTGQLRLLHARQAALRRVPCSNGYTHDLLRERGVTSTTGGVGAAIGSAIGIAIGWPSCCYRNASGLPTHRVTHRRIPAGCWLADSRPRCRRRFAHTAAAASALEPACWHRRPCRTAPWHSAA